MLNQEFIAAISKAVGRNIPGHMPRVLIRRGILVDVRQTAFGFEFSQDNLDAAVEHFSSPRSHDWPKLPQIRNMTNDASNANNGP